MVLRVWPRGSAVSYFRYFSFVAKPSLGHTQLVNFFGHDANITGLHIWFYDSVLCSRIFRKANKWLEPRATRAFA